MMGLPDGRKKFKIGLAVLIQYRRATSSQPASHVAVAYRPTGLTIRRAGKKGNSSYRLIPLNASVVDILQIWTQFKQDL